MPDITRLSRRFERRNDWATSIYTYLTNSIWGAGEAAAAINIASFIAVRNKQQIQLNYTPTLAGPELLCNAIIDTAKPVIDNLTTMTRNANCGLVWRNGQYHLVHNGDKILPGATSVVPVMDIGPDMIIGEVSSSAPGVGERYTQGIARYKDPENDWEIAEAIFPETTSGQYRTYLSEDNNTPYVTTINLDHCTNKYQAGRYIRQIVQNSRDLESYIFTATAEAKELTPGDPFRLSCL